MPILPFLEDKTVAVMGLGRSGTATARALEASGAAVWAWDDGEAARDQAMARGLILTDLYGADLGQADLVVWSPGIAHTHPKPHPLAERARALGLQLVCDIDLLVAAKPGCRFIGITGTNGKSTTTTLIAHLLAQAGIETAAGGNLGLAALDMPDLGPQGVYVLELSSYQLELLDRAAFDLGVLLNITPDHLGRHGGMAGYVAAKASLFERLKPGGRAVIGIDDAACLGIYERLAGLIGEKAVPVSAERRLDEGVSAPDGQLIDRRGGADIRIDLAGLPRLPGRHNWQNACAAYVAGRAFGLSPDAIATGLASFAGLAHRQELIAEIDGIAYVNDSKATNADAAEKAMVCYETIYWILGGQAKEGGIASLAPLFPRVRRAFLIGEAAEAFAATLSGKVATERCHTLEVAVAKAREAALADGIEGAVVLLSPASASWDQFKSFEERGETFRRLVDALPGARRVP